MSGNKSSDDLRKLPFMITLVLGLPTFVAFTQNRSAAEEDPVLRTEATEAKRKGAILNIVKSVNEKNKVETVFYENLKSGVMPVAIGFYDKKGLLAG